MSTWSFQASGDSDEIRVNRLSTQKSVPFYNPSNDYKLHIFKLFQISFDYLKYFISHWKTRKIIYITLKKQKIFYISFNEQKYILYNIESVENILYHIERVKNKKIINLKTDEGYRMLSNPEQHVKFNNILRVMSYSVNKIYFHSYI